MAKPYSLKKGDRVRVVNLLLAGGGDEFLFEGDVGTLVEDDTDQVPFIKWDGKEWNRNEGAYAAIVDGLEKIDD